MLIAASGFARRIQYPCNERFIGVNISPRPSAYTGLLLIKNGQSLPSCNAIFSSSSLFALTEKKEFNADKMNDASAEPPPKPPPKGMFLSSFM